jgi:alpha-mannosidase
VDHNRQKTSAKIAQFLQQITPFVYEKQQELPPWHFRLVENLDPALLQPDDGPLTGEIIPPNSYWGAQNQNFVLQTTFNVRETFSAGAPLALHLPIGDAGEFSHPEALAYIDGRPLAAVDRHHQELRLPARFADGRPHHLLLHGWTGNLGSTDPKPGQKLFMRPCRLVQIHQPTRDFLILARTALETADLLPEIDPARDRLYNALEAAYRAVRFTSPADPDFYDSIPAAMQALETGIAAAGPPLDAEIIAAGHAHIDVAWLWTLAQTREKARRTSYNVLHLMDEFPAYQFTQSQPQLYDYVRKDDPALFAAIQERVADGRWEPIGGMWVEADCNISGPESLARQFLLGRTFFRDHFGPEAESPVLWLPDVFGYSWSLPQLIKLAGLEYFFTIKIGWNQTNKMPFDSFWWQGIDGTRVLTHFSTTPTTPWSGKAEISDLMNMATYNAILSPFSARGSWTRLQHKADQRTMLMSYGYGDGGGGPTREMNENALPLREFPSQPRVKQGKVIDFFRRLDTESGEDLPLWNNELYLEIHRGTYTTQARNKRANRQSEFMLHDAEFLAAQAALLDETFIYPHAQLRRAWELVCLNQFHDIIPGSSINAVYVDSLAQYGEIAELATAVRQSALATIQQHRPGDLLINPAGFPRHDLAHWPTERLPVWAAREQAQRVDDGWLLGGLALAPYQILVSPPVAAKETQPLSVSPHHLENDLLRVELNEAGDITRLYDKRASRELLPEGAVANELQAFVDRPLKWDAWDVDIFFEDKMVRAERATAVTVLETGPLRATIEIRRRILHSHIRQRISLTHDSPLLRFDNEIDWRERHILLKTAFPLQILSPTATHEIQWGSVQRPTHRNTSWDWARFETAAQKWVDLSEGGYGVALLNDCKYGHDVHQNVIRLSLLRAPTRPDPEADQGVHRFAYALFPHANPAGGQLVPSQVAGEAYRFNDPIIAAPGKVTSGQSNLSPPSWKGRKISSSRR